MGTGFHGGFGNSQGSKKKTNSKNIKLPENNAQLKHIFSGKEGHYSDTKQNRTILYNLANNDKYFVGKDRYGNSWNVKLNSKGEQIWVRYQNKKINEGGKNKNPRKWDKDTGLNNNPKNRFKK